MNRLLITVLVALSFLATARAEIQTRTVTYADGGVGLQGFIAWDDAVPGKRPGVIVVHEWWGHNAYARSRAEQLAGLGYTAMALDMYGDGKSVETPAEASALAGPFYKDLDLTRSRFDAALKVLKDHPTVAPDRIAAIGYCFGGTVVLNMARLGVDLDGVVSFHGGLKTPHPAEADTFKAKVLVCNGAADPMVPEEDRRGFKAEMKAAKVDFDFRDYPGALHAFTNPKATATGKKYGIPVAYDAAADKASWKAMKAFLAGLFQ